MVERVLEALNRPPPAGPSQGPVMLTDGPMSSLGPPEILVYYTDWIMEFLQMLPLPRLLSLEMEEIICG